MKKSSLIFLAFIVLILFNNNIYSQWYSVENGSTSNIWEIKFKNENTGWYISGRNQIYKTTNGSLNWKCLDIPYIDTLDYLHNLNVIGDTLWMMINGGRVLKSTNGGDNWSVISSVINQELGTCSIVRNNLIYALFYNGSQATQIIKTNNIFNNQVPIFSISAAGFYDINMSSDLDFVNDSIGYLRGEWRLYKTTNAGYNWFTVYFDSVNINSPTIDYIKFIDKDNGFLRKHFDGLYRTTNGGVNWQFIMNTPSSSNIKIIFKDNSKGYMMPIASLFGMFYKTTNGGFNWNLQYYDTASIKERVFNDFEMVANTIYVAAFQAGDVLKSTDEGISWTESTPYFRNELISAIYFINAQTGFIGTSDDYLLKTTNAGINWIVVDTLCNISIWSKEIKRIQFLDEQTGWLLSDSGLFKTTNSGNNWIYNQNYFMYPTNFNFINYNTGFVTAFAEIKDTIFTALYKTTNGGINFYLTHYLNASGTYIQFYDSLYGYLLCQNYLNSPELYRTTDGGFNWEPNFSVSFVATVYIQNRNIAYLGESPLNSTGGILKTTNGGDNWFRVLNCGKTIYNILFTDLNNGFAIGEKNFYYTTNGGNNWTYSFIGLNNTLFNLYKTSENILFATGSEGKIYKSTNYGGIFIGINNNEIIIPNEIRLFQNYPNPFNPSTKIKFEIPRRSPAGAFGDDKVVLKVYDILGKEIETLVNEKLNPGTYEVTFNASQYPSGVYFYRLQAGDYNESKKMILLK